MRKWLALFFLICSPAFAQQPGTYPIGPGPSGGGGTTAGGIITACGASNNQVLYDNAGSCAGASGLTYTSGVVNVGAGSAAAPTLTVGNATTGFYSVSTTGFGISVNGAVKVDFGISSSNQWNFEGITVNTGRLVPSPIGSPSVVLNGTGNYGNINNVDAHTWSLGWSGSITSIGTSIISWTDNGTVTIAPNNSITTITGSLTVSALANVATTSAVCYNTGTGVLTYDGTLGTCTVSAARFKNGFKTIADATALDMVLAMKPKSWHYKWEPDRERIGLVANDLFDIDPRLVGLDKDGQVTNDDYWAVITLQTGAIRKLKSELEQLKARIQHDHHRN